MKLTNCDNEQAGFKLNENWDQIQKWLVKLTQLCTYRHSQVCFWNVEEAGVTNWRKSTTKMYTNRGKPKVEVLSWAFVCALHTQWERASTLTAMQRKQKGKTSFKHPCSISAHLAAEWKLSSLGQNVPSSSSYIVINIRLRAAWDLGPKMICRHVCDVKYEAVSNKTKIGGNMSRYFDENVSLVLILSCPSSLFLRQPSSPLCFRAV